MSKANETANDVLKVVAQRAGVRSIEVAEELGLGESTVRHHLKAWCQGGEIIRREEEGKVLYFSPASPIRKTKPTRSTPRPVPKRVAEKETLSSEMKAIDAVLSEVRRQVSESVRLIVAKTLIKTGSDLL